MPNNFTKKFLPFNFKNPFELLTFYDDNILNGLYCPYKIQIDILKEFSLDIPIDDHFRQISVVAANGSGKSQFIVAPCVLWLAVSFDTSLSYVTSSSASQLDTQTERYIDFLAGKMNQKHAQDLGQLWDIVKRKKVFRPTESFVDLFATDEPSKAEGKHPLTPNGEFGIFVDEGKSVAPDIYEAIDRCVGFTRRLDVSSPGSCNGHFYNINTIEELIYSKKSSADGLRVINTKLTYGWRNHKIVAFDCPHISKNQVNALIAKHGLHDPFVRSAVFAEFSSTEEKVVITKETIDSCDRLWIGRVDSDYHGGLDLARGGDEVVLNLWLGNEMVGQETCRIKDSVQTADEIIMWCRKYASIGFSAAKTNADDGGIGAAILDILEEKGFSFQRILNNRRALDSKRYVNVGAEMWFNFARLVEENIVKLLPDRTLKSQLANRYYKRQETTQRLILESKEQARAKGHPSPDRADACVLAWYGVDLDDYLSKPAKTKKKEVTTRFTDEQAAEFYDKIAYGDEEFEFRDRSSKALANCSLTTLLSSYSK